MADSYYFSSLVSFFLILLPGSLSSELVLTVAADGSGNFTTIGEAIDFVPSRRRSDGLRTKIMVKAGVYLENLVVPREKVNVSLMGAGSSRTIISGNRSSSSGWTTFTSATLAIEGSGFAAFDLTVQNTAGPSHGQAVALRTGGDKSAFHRCIIDGHQDTLYLHVGTQFFRDCEIRGTVDFIFGEATSVFQKCQIIPRGAKGGTITAQGRTKQSERSAFSFDNCTIKPFSSDVPPASFYLGRPWRPYATVVFMNSYMAEVVSPEGWVPWDGSGKPVPETIFYGEYENSGPGAAASGRVRWKGVWELSRDEASRFSVSGLIAGESWIPVTGVPYDSQI